MKHTIRQRVINEYGLPVTKVTTMQGELGTGAFDKNGVDIFEGDIVSNGKKNFPVKFINGALYIFNESDGEGYNITQEFAQAFEVVGHVEDAD